MAFFSKDYYSSEEWKARVDLAAAYQLASLFQWTDLIYTHISARVPSEKDTFLINPFGLHFHEITPENLVKVSLDGKILSDTPYGINPAGLVIHSAIHEARNDIGAVVHLHTINGMSIAALKDGLLPISQHACHFYGKIAYHDYEGIAVHANEKKRLVKDLGNKNTMILRNHGFLTAGQNIAEAFTSMWTLEKAAKVQIATFSMGLPVIVPAMEVCEGVVEDTGKRGIKECEMEWQALKRLLPDRINQGNVNVTYSNSMQTVPRTASQAPYRLALQ